MKHISILTSVTIVLISCHNTFDVPIYTSNDINFVAQTHNEIDANRLCLGELLSEAFNDIDFRHLIKVKSINNLACCNNEIILLDLLYQDIKPNFNLLNLLSNTLAQSEELCFSNIEEVIAAVNNDPLLVIKIPDLFNPELWDDEEIIPFVYVNTIQLVSDSIGSSTGSYIGFHGSGCIDRYVLGVPKYFPIVLKWSEEYLLFSSDFVLYQNIEVSRYHDFVLSHPVSSGVFDKKVFINGVEYFVYPWNLFIKEINISSNFIRVPYSLDTCFLKCPLECIPEDERKVTYKKVIVHSQNIKSLNYEFTEFFRWGTDLIFVDNVMPLTMLRHGDKNGSGIWQKRLLGSFSLRSLFDIDVNYGVINSKYLFNDNLVKLPELSLTLNVNAKKSIDTGNNIFIENVKPGDLLSFVSSRLKVERLGQEHLLINGDVVWASKFVSDAALIYDSFCIERNDTLGFNSISLICDY
jgi:hypothetical protein